MGLRVMEVTSRQELNQFIKFPDKLYSGNKFYVPAIHKNVLRTLSQGKNPAYEFCIAKYWLAYRYGEIVGRVAGIINESYNAKHNVKYVRIGWLDFIDDKKVLSLLIQVVRRWAINHGMEYIHGPLGFTTFDPSGVLIEGFEEISSSFAHYNFPYYSSLLEEQGFIKDADWVEFNVKVPKTVPMKFIQGAELIKTRYNLHCAVLEDKKDILRYSDDVFMLLNEEYKDLYAYSELTKKQKEILKKQFISILKPDYVSIILNESDNVVAFGITMPSLSKALQRSKGKLFPTGFIHVLRALKQNDTVDTLLIAIQKDYQNKGLNGLIFNDLMSAYIKNGITNLETTRELEGNMRINNLWNKFEYRLHKRTRCYIKKI